MSTPIDRRAFLRVLGSGSAALVLAPLTTACSSSAAPASGAASAGGEAADPLAIPLSKPARWEPIAFNRARGHAGAIPESYWPSIDGDDGAANHLGKHLPYIPTAADATAPEGMVAIMWGDPEKGHARHPNAVRSDANQGEGHWYNWIEIRKATDDDAPSARSTYPEWPGDADGGFAVAGGGELTDDGGKNTVYLAALPAGVGPGDTVRIYAHCLTHGEYVDFLVLPG